MAASSLAQTAGLPATDDSTHQLSVSLWLPQNNRPLHAPAGIQIFAFVSSSASAQKGEVVRVDFYADVKALGSTKVVWHEGIHPDPHSNRPQPMIIVPPGFSPATFVWSNAPAGSYTLTARATAVGGVTVVSPPVSLTVLP
jgi:hypothetical protein